MYKLKLSYSQDTSSNFSQIACPYTAPSACSLPIRLKSGHICGQGRRPPLSAPLFRPKEESLRGSPSPPYPWAFSPSCRPRSGLILYHSAAHNDGLIHCVMAPDILALKANLPAMGQKAAVNEITHFIQHTAASTVSSCPATTAAVSSAAQTTLTASTIPASSISSYLPV